MQPILNFSKQLWPLFLLLGLITCRSFINLIPINWQNLLLLSLPVFTLSLSTFLSLKFNQTRLFQAQLLVLMAFLLPINSHLSGYFHYSVTIATLSLTLVVLSLSKDRLLLSYHGLLRALILATLTIALIFLAAKYTPLLNQLFSSALITLPLPPSTLQTYLPSSDQLTAIIIIACFMHGIAGLFAKQANLQGKFIAFQCALLILASAQSTSLLQTLALLAVSTVIIIAVIGRSYDMAYRDELTALPSRRALNQKLLSLGRNYTIAMLDIDHFKKFNDTHGHDVGDEVLRMVASKIAKVGGGGKPFRYGGEEFTVVFAGQSPEQAEPHLNALRQAIEEYKMTVRSKKRKQPSNHDKSAKAKRGKKNINDNGKLSVTISIGLAHREGTAKTPEQVIKASDEALYRAKKAGRNCVSK